jgi:glycosyltransferase involved in cell wall biosynthesis
MRIALAMIVKNEAHIIKRCLDSVLPYIDAWCICDTGSTDGTQDIIRQVMAGLPGILYEHPWRDFGWNRSRALDGARKLGADYIMTLDADEVLVVHDPGVFEMLDGPAYRFMCRFPDMTYSSNRLVRADLGWRYEGVLHEYPTCGAPVAEITLDSVWLLEDGAGARGRDPEKMAKDIAVLEEALAENPAIPRYWFYLGMTLMANNEPEKAMNAFFRRSEMGDYIEEVFYSRLQIGQLHAIAGNWTDAVAAYLSAYGTLPSRAESLYWLAAGYLDRKAFAPAILFLEEAVVIPKPIGALFVADPVYDYLCLLQLAVAYYWVGRYTEAVAINEALLAHTTMPAEVTELVQRNLAYCTTAQAKQVA